MGARIRKELPHLSAARRAAMAELPLAPELHSRLLEELGFLDDVEVAPPPEPAGAPPRAARIVSWNAERGRRLAGSVALLRRSKADACLLSELDCGMARSGQHHTAAELARALGTGHAYGIEFVELGLGDPEERRAVAGSDNAIGYHGGAILSPHPLADPAVLRLDRSGRWFDGELGERRVGGRIAILATLLLAGGPVTLASVHLESHSDPEHRAEQFGALLDAIDRRRPGGAAVIGGDVNTSSLGLDHLRDPERLKRALAEDPERLVRPEPHEPLFRLAEARGYDWRGCNRLEVSTQRKRDARRGTLHLDWMFCRGVETSDPETIAALDPETDEALSDHEAVAVTVSLA